MLITRLEHLPNELLLQILTYSHVRDLSRAFWNLNSRFNQLIRSLTSLSLVLNGRKSIEGDISHLLPQIVRLVIVTVEQIPLNSFSNLRSLIVNLAVPSYLKEIQAKNFPRLEFLSIPIQYPPIDSNPIASTVFSNEFLHLRYAEFGMISDPQSFFWSISVSLRSLRLILSEMNYLPRILLHCPSLSHLFIRMKSIDARRMSLDQNLFPSNFLHPLKSFQFISLDSDLLTDDLSLFLIFVPNLHTLDLRSSLHSCLPFFQFICKIFPNLRLFHCHLIEDRTNELAIELDRLRSLHPCFISIQRTYRDDNTNLYSTLKQ